MPKRYRVHAYEPEPIKHSYRDPVDTPEVAADDAEEWASHYYGSDATTWSVMQSPDHYLVGQVLENGERSPVKCIITVEEYADDDDA
jgi:hypothetical protein